LMAVVRGRGSHGPPKIMGLQRIAFQPGSH
jgi:hypothetical protein